MKRPKILTHVAVCAFMLAVGIADCDRVLGNDAAIKLSRGPVVAGDGTIIQPTANRTSANELKFPLKTLLAPLLNVGADNMRLHIPALRYSAVGSIANSGYDPRGNFRRRIDPVTKIFEAGVNASAHANNPPSPRSSKNLPPARRELNQFSEKLAATKTGSETNGGGIRQTLETRGASDGVFSGSDSTRQDGSRTSIPVVEAARKKSKSKPTVVVLAHPHITSEITKLLSRTRSKTAQRRFKLSVIDTMERSNLAIPPAASVYVVDAHAFPAVLARIFPEDRMQKQSPDAKVIVLAKEFSEAGDRTFNFPLLNLKVNGLIRFDEIKSQLTRAISQVLDGGNWIPASILQRYGQDIHRGTWDSKWQNIIAPKMILSRRERQVLDGLLEILSNKEIAAKINLSERTVKFHVSSLLAKFKVRGRAEVTDKVRRQNESSLPYFSNDTLGAKTP